MYRQTNNKKNMGEYIHLDIKEKDDTQNILTHFADAEAPLVLSASH